MLLHFGRRFATVHEWPELLEAHDVEQAITKQAAARQSLATRPFPPGGQCSAEHDVTAKCRKLSPLY